MTTFTRTIDIDSREIQKFLCWPIEIIEATIEVNYYIDSNGYAEFEWDYLKFNNYNINEEQNISLWKKFKLSNDFIETLIYENEEKLKDEWLMAQAEEREYRRFYGS